MRERDEIVGGTGIDCPGAEQAGGGCIGSV